MLDEKMNKVLDYYNKGLQFYKERKFQEALMQFKSALELKPDDGPSKLYHDRCEILKKDPPPADWDGVFTMTTK